MTKKTADMFFPVDTLSIIPGTSGKFDLYLKRGETFVLYCPKGERFDEERLSQVLEVTEFFVMHEERMEYERYLAKNLGDLLSNESVPIKTRARVFYSISQSVVQQAFDSKIPKPVSRDAQKRLFDVVNGSIAFFAREGSLKSFSQFISHDYHTYSHSVHVMVLALSVLQHFPNMDKQVLADVAMGALLHDIGKTVIPLDILNTNPRELTTAQWDVLKTHSAKGVQMCAGMQLNQETLNCILFHHERLDGKGYPAGLEGDDIPFTVRAVAVCNIYDALTSNHAYAKGMDPFDALNYMREEMSGVYDRTVFKRLVFVLGNAGISRQP